MPEKIKFRRGSELMPNEVEELDPALVVDTAIDDILAAFNRIDENLPKIHGETVPQTAGIDAATEAYQHGVKPYFADFIKGLSLLETTE